MSNFREIFEHIRPENTKIIRESMSGNILALLADKGLTTDEIKLAHEINQLKDLDYELLMKAVEQNNIEKILEVLPIETTPATLGESVTTPLKQHYLETPTMTDPKDLEMVRVIRPNGEAGYIIKVEPELDDEGVPTKVEVSNSYKHTSGEIMNVADLKVEFNESEMKRDDFTYRHEHEERVNANEAKPKVEIKSILEPIVTQARDMIDKGENTELVKKYVVGEISKHTGVDPQDLKKMVFEVNRSKDAFQLLKYLYNAILKYEGLGTIKKAGQAVESKIKETVLYYNSTIDGKEYTVEKTITDENNYVYFIFDGSGDELWSDTYTKESFKKISDELAEKIIDNMKLTEAKISRYEVIIPGLNDKDNMKDQRETTAATEIQAVANIVSRLARSNMKLKYKGIEVSPQNIGLLISKIDAKVNKLTEGKINEEEGLTGNNQTVPNEMPTLKQPEEKAKEKEKPIVVKEPEETKNIEAVKEYLGNSGNENFYYLNTVPKDGEGVKALEVLDSNDEVVYTTEKSNLDPNDIKGFILNAIKEKEIANISTDIVNKYIFPSETPEAVVAEEKPQEEEVKKPEEEKPIDQENAAYNGPLESKLMEKFDLKVDLSELHNDLLKLLGDKYGFTGEMINTIEEIIKDNLSESKDDFTKKNNLFYFLGRIKGIIELGEVSYKSKQEIIKQLQDAVNQVETMLKEAKIKEGTWKFDKKVAQYALDDLEAFKEKYFETVGDDEIYDGIDAAINRIHLLLKPGSVVWFKKNESKIKESDTGDAPNARCPICGEEYPREKAIKKNGEYVCPECAKTNESKINEDKVLLRNIIGLDKAKEFSLSKDYKGMKVEAVPDDLNSGKYMLIRVDGEVPIQRTKPGQYSEGEPTDPKIVFDDKSWDNEEHTSITYYKENKPVAKWTKDKGMEILNQVQANEALPGEVTGGESSTKCECGKTLPLKVLKSNAGYYYGYFCGECGPSGRESGYFKTKEEAEQAMKELSGMRESIDNLLEKYKLTGNKVCTKCGKGTDLEECPRCGALTIEAEDQIDAAEHMHGRVGESKIDNLMEKFKLNEDDPNTMGEQKPEEEKEKKIVEEPVANVPSEEPPINPDASIDNTPVEGEEQEIVPTTVESARAKIEMDYPESPMKEVAIAYADSLINDPKLYEPIRQLKFDGIWVNADDVIKQSKIVGEYGNFTPDAVKRLTDRLGDVAKYKIGRDNGPIMYITIRDGNVESISLDGLKEITKAKEVVQTGNPGEVILRWG